MKLNNEIIMIFIN